jgi:purine-nucleoside/S-methyl-5'-thioadenosine phosphorylase / adenosine deaminase
MTPALTNKRPAPRRSNPRRAAARTTEWNLRGAGGLKILEAPALAKLPWLLHGFSTRLGGASKLAPPAVGQKAQNKILNLGFTDWDLRARVTENRKKFFGAIGASKMRVIALRQIHSDIVHLVSAENVDAAEEPPQGDALITRERGVSLAVQTADCVPILLADKRHHAIAVVHAGWRGTLSRIAEKTLGRMHMEFGTRPEDVVAALGPSIGRCCYEVGSDVAKEFHAQFPDAREWFDGPYDALAAGENDPNWLPWLTMKPPGHAPPPLTVQLDLISANRGILAGAGVPPANISSSHYCTACRTDLFFSYRRERTTGRLMAAIAIR